MDSPRNVSTFEFPYIAVLSEDPLVSKKYIMPRGALTLDLITTTRGTRLNLKSSNS